MECNFTVGQKVVCIDALTNSRTIKLPELEEGGVYTIRKIGVQEIPDVFEPELSVWLEGVTREVLSSKDLSIICDDFGFRPSRFRPVVERKTDISVFKAMLNPSKEQVPA